MAIAECDDFSDDDEEDAEAEAPEAGPHPPTVASERMAAAADVTAADEQYDDFADELD